MSFRTVSELLSKPWSEETESSVDETVLNEMMIAASALHAMITTEVAPASYWPSLIGAAQAAGMWAMRPSPFTLAQVQDIVVSFEVRLFVNLVNCSSERSCCCCNPSWGYCGSPVRTLLRMFRVCNCSVFCVAVV